MISDPALFAIAVVTATLGALGGLGGAVLMVPTLVLAGVEPQLAAPIGLFSVAAGALSAGGNQLAEGLVHHRLGVTIEIGASLGAIGGVLVGEALSADALSRILALVALIAAGAGARRKGLRNQPHASFAGERAGEWPGSLSGAYRLGDHTVPYTARHIRIGVVLTSLAGFVAGISGTSGGFLKTPVLSEVMHVPVKVAAATATFTVTITSGVALLVYAAHGSIEARPSCVVVIGALAGGRLGAVLQSRLPPPYVRRALSAILAVVGIALLVRG